MLLFVLLLIVTQILFYFCTDIVHIYLECIYQSAPVWRTSNNKDHINIIYTNNAFLNEGRKCFI